MTDELGFYLRQDERGDWLYCEDGEERAATLPERVLWKALAAQVAQATPAQDIPTRAVPSQAQHRAAMAYMAEKCFAVPSQYVEGMLQAALDATPATKAEPVGAQVHPADKIVAEIAAEVAAKAKKAEATGQADDLQRDYARALDTIKGHVEHIRVLEQKLRDLQTFKDGVELHQRGGSNSWYWMDDRENYLDTMVASLPVVIRAEQLRELLAAPKAEATGQAEPNVWLVLDKAGALVHAAAWREAAHEHINDAINEHGIQEAARWVVRPAWIEPPKAAQPLTGLELSRAIEAAISESAELASVSGSALLRLIRSTERAHGIGGEGKE